MFSTHAHFQVNVADRITVRMIKGSGDLTINFSYYMWAFEQRIWPGSWKFDDKISKSSNAQLGACPKGG